MPFLFSSGVFAVDDEFPGRDEFPDVLVYEKSELFTAFSDVVLVDTRTKYEFETLRIKDAINIPLSSQDFAKKVQQLRASTSKPIVFYCNNRNCYKSYRAGREANYLNIEDTYAYDAGVYEWAKTYPNHVTLLGMIPGDSAAVNPENKVHISFVGPWDYVHRLEHSRSGFTIVSLWISFPLITHCWLNKYFMLNK